MLTTLLTVVSAVKNLELFKVVVYELLLLFLSKTLHLVSLGEALLSLINSILQVKKLVVKLALLLVLATDQVLVRLVLRTELLIKRSLDVLLLKINVSDSAVLVSSLVKGELLKHLLLILDVAVSNICIFNALLSQSSLGSCHPLLELKLLGVLLLFQLLSQLRLLILVSLLNCKRGSAGQVALVKTEHLELLGVVIQI